MAQYKVIAPLYVSSLKKLFQPGDAVDLTGGEEKVALHYRAVVAVPDTAPVKPSVTATPSAPAKSAVSASNAPAKPGDAK